MLLQNKQTGTLVEILDLEALISPAQNNVTAQIQEGQEEQDPEQMAKRDLIFPSGEALPQCWLDANYQMK